MKDIMWGSPPYCSDPEASSGTGLTGGIASQESDCSQGIHKHFIAKVELYQN